MVRSLKLTNEDKRVAEIMRRGYNGGTDRILIAHEINSDHQARIVALEAEKAELVEEVRRLEKLLNPELEPYTGGKKYVSKDGEHPTVRFEG